jgi:RNA polymerase sigma-70 factor (ECF subfamily)
LNTKHQHIEKAKLGQQQAFNVLLESHWDYVYNYLYKQTKDTYLSEEICIKTFARAFDKIDQFDKKYNFKTWLVTISKRLLIDEKRKKELETTKIDKHVNAIESNEENIEEEIHKKEHLNTVKMAMNQLKSSDKLVLQKHFFEEKSYAEIAKDIDESVNFIKVKILRAKRKLADIIKLNGI